MAEKPPTYKYHLWQLGLLLLIGGMIGWSAFFKPTTRIADGGTQNNYYEVPKVPMFGCSLWRLRSELFWQSKTPIIKQKVDKK